MIDGALEVVFGDAGTTIANAVIINNTQTNILTIFLVINESPSLILIINSFMNYLIVSVMINISRVKKGKLWGSKLKNKQNLMLKGMEAGLRHRGSLRSSSVGMEVRQLNAVPALFRRYLIILK